LIFAVKSMISSSKRKRKQIMTLTYSSSTNKQKTYANLVTQE